MADNNLRLAQGAVGIYGRVSITAYRNSTFTIPSESATVVKRRENISLRPKSIAFSF
ncbi:hypothetical protein [Endozoicomonas sp. SESOKO1]|uniref:hypothetical protein n=1 Tax=Endozoicomonas sp. SESOKO1 TaxID=2828742 RepID=UPI0021476642|nr:hypothetical protein [Endozoicomonas sp. SESOKO1]